MKRIINKLLMFVIVLVCAVTLIACTSEKIVTIVLCPNNGNPNITIGTNSEKDVDSLLTFSSYGYFFVGWYYDPEFKNRVTLPTRFEKDTVLYGGWHTYVTYELDELTDSYAVSGVVLPFTTVEILPEYNGKKVTTIKEKAFKGNESIINLVLPDSITTIEDNAFSNMTNLETINLPDSLTSIGKNIFTGSTKIAYDNHSGLKYIDNWLVDAKDCTIQNVILKPETIGIFSEAFKNCYDIIQVTIPAHLWYLGENVFECNTSLEKIEVSEYNKTFTSLNGTLYNKDMTSLIKYPSARVNVEITLPASLKNIESMAFDRCNNLKTVNITNNIQTIQKYAFYNCKELTSVNIDTDSVLIDIDAFYNCPKLK